LIKFLHFHISVYVVSSPRCGIGTPAGRPKYDGDVAIPVGEGVDIDDGDDNGELYGPV